MFYEAVHHQMPKMLKNLSACLDKAAGFADSKKIEVEVLLSSRLAPDQFNLIKQVQIACDISKFGAARLTGKDAPVHEDNEKTLAEVKARLKSVATYLEAFTAKDFESAATRKITQQRWEGKTMAGSDYLAEYVLPNLYFHVTTAYAILRHNGVEVGKKDYLGAMPYQS